MEFSLLSSSCSTLKLDVFSSVGSGWNHIVSEKAVNGEKYGCLFFTFFALVSVWKLCMLIKYLSGLKFRDLGFLRIIHFFDFFLPVIISIIVFQFRQFISKNLAHFCILSIHFQLLEPISIFNNFNLHPFLETYIYYVNFLSFETWRGLFLGVQFTLDSQGFDLWRKTI